MPRFRFGAFVLSPRRRALLRDGREQPLIPRYFDLLVYLVERRGEAVHRRDIFDHVWTDVVVSDSALSQAVRTIRRVLGDDSREPRFVRTVSRHGYQFVHPDVTEEPDDGGWPADVHASTIASPAPEPAEASPAPDPFPSLVERILRPAAILADEEAQREAAERLHAMGTAEALRRLPAGQDAAFARALLRETRWDVAEAGTVPLAGEPHALRVGAHIVRLRWRRAARLAAGRTLATTIGAGGSGAIGGLLGGMLLGLTPGGSPMTTVAPVLAVVGGACGAMAGLGVGGGVSLAETLFRSRRTLALVAGGVAGGGGIGAIVQFLATATLSLLVGVNLGLGGAVEGVAIGGAAALAYALTTVRSDGGLAAPRGKRRGRTVGAVVVACGLAALALSMAGRPLVGGTLHLVAHASAGGPGLLAPLGPLVGEPGFGPLTAALLSLGEGAVFGLGLSLGLTRRG